MKKLFLAFLSICLCFSFTACMSGEETTGSKTDETSSMTSSKTEIIPSESSKEASAADESSVMSDTALKDGTYKAEGKDYSEDGYKPTVTLTVSDGKISDIDLDAVNEKGEHKKDSDQDDWIDKIVIFEKEMVAKGLEALDIATDGTVNGIEGFDLNLGEYTPLINEAIDKAKK